MAELWLETTLATAATAGGHAKDGRQAFHRPRAVLLEGLAVFV